MSSPAHPHQIHDLRHLSPPSSSLLTQLRAGLTGNEWIEVPDSASFSSDSKNDGKDWRYRRSLPTMLLYDEEGLKLYEKITKDVPEYYLYPSELGLLAKHSGDIVKHLFPNNTPSSSSNDVNNFDSGSADKDDEHKRDSPPPSRRPPVPRWRVGDWGGETVGKWNDGVNGEEGLTEGEGKASVQVTMEGDAKGREKVERGEEEKGGCGKGELEGVVLELGAGSLGKTSHLLSALSSRPSTTLPIQYLALDLDSAELTRTLTAVQSSSQLGPKLEQGNVKVGGVWGTFDAGLEWAGKGKHLGAVLKALGAGDGSEGASSSSSSEDGSKEGKSAVSTSSHSPEPVFPTSLPISPPSTPSHSNPTSLFSSSPTNPTLTPTHYLFLGSSLGNFPRPSASDFLLSLPLLPGSGSCLVLGLDCRNEKGMVERAYNDEGGVTREWAENMWKGVEGLVGWEGEKGLKEGWEYVGRYNVQEGRHEAYFRSLRPQSLTLPATSSDPSLTIDFEQDELLNIEWSYKYSPAEAQKLFSESNLRPVDSYVDEKTGYTVWVLERPPFAFQPISAAVTQHEAKALPSEPVAKVSNNDEPTASSSDPSSPPLSSCPNTTTTTTTTDTVAISPSEKVSNPYGVPTVKEWEELWAFWDTITLGMIKKEMLLQKPIDLRHKNLFYIGHIPAFLDIFLSRNLNEPHSEPEYFKDLFERGIDPSVLDPTQCHSHSIVPEKDEDWPCLELILTFRDRVRRRLLAIYSDVESGKRVLDRRLGRILFMTYEHEAMHAETLLYMLLQSPHTLPPPGFARPSFSSSSSSSSSISSPSDRILIPSTVVILGHHDLESDDSSPPASWQESHEFGWDNEHSDGSQVEVGSFEIEWRGVTNGEYKAFLEGKKDGSKKIPGSWIEKDGEWMIKSLYGPLSFSQAGSWPLMASYDELLAYAQSKGGRLPTEPELRVWLDRYSSSDAREGANVGLRNWVPVEAQPPIIDSSTKKVLRKGHNGGVWEWSSSSLKPLSGYVTSELYPGYSSDFFDEEHLVVLGGSFATIPRLASRRSVRNFYQHNYPFAWVGGHVVYDMPSDDKK